jgi:hypothetical protein
VCTTIAAVIAGVVAAVLLLDKAPPVISEPPATPLPTMQGDVRIAIAEFGRWQSGVLEPWPAGQELARNVARDLDGFVRATPTASPSANPGPASLVVQVHGPDLIRPIDGTTPLERAVSARALATEIGADAILYGALREDNDTFIPEMYLSNRVLSRDGSTTDAGQYNYGELRIRDGAALDLSIDNRKELQDALVRQAGALVYFLRGVNAYVSNRADLAPPYFEAAQTVLVQQRGTELFELFLGNAAIKQAARASGGPRAHLLNLAHTHYQNAIGIAPGFARATIGLAETWYLNSSRGCERTATDLSGLDTAVRYYNDARAADPSSPLANVKAKAQFGLGRAYACAIVAGSTTYTAEAAEHELRYVIAAYDGGNGEVGSWAREAYAMLGFLHLQHGSVDAIPNPLLAASDILSSIEIELKLGNQSGRMRSLCSALADAEGHIADPNARPSRTSQVFQQSGCVQTARNVDPGGDIPDVGG